MKIRPVVKRKRLDSTASLYKGLEKANEKIKEQIFHILKNSNNAESDTTDKCYSALGNNLSTVLSFCRKNYESFEEGAELVLDDLLYQEDDKTLEERIHICFKKYPLDNPISLLTHLSVILDTETYHITNKVIEFKTNPQYVEIIRDTYEDCSDDSECDDLCEKYSDGEIHEVGSIPLPPYHPECRCQAIFYISEDIERGVE